MPRLTARPLFAAPGVTVRHVTCDGVDPPRPTEEGGDDARLVIVMHGRFAFEDGGGRGGASPAVGLFLPAGHTYRIRHIDVGDTSIAVQGACCDALLEAGPICRRLSVSGFLSIRELAARLLRGEALTRLAVEEIVASALGGDRASTGPRRPRDRAVAGAIAYELERDIDARLGLPTLASKRGVSVFTRAGCSSVSPGSAFTSTTARCGCATRSRGCSIPAGRSPELPWTPALPTRRTSPTRSAGGSGRRPDAFARRASARRTPDRRRGVRQA